MVKVLRLSRWQSVQSWREKYSIEASSKWITGAWAALNTSVKGIKDLREWVSKFGLAGVCGAQAWQLCFGVLGPGQRPGPWELWGKSA